MTDSTQPASSGASCEPAETPVAEARSQRVNVCPRCSNGRPTCRDRRPDGTRYTHAETCDTYHWATDVCDDCKPAFEMETTT